MQTHIVPRHDGQGFATLRRSVTLHGHLTGNLWWPQVPAYKAASDDLLARARRMVGGRPTLREVMESYIMENDGDFSTPARLTADSYITVEHVTGRLGTEVIRRRHIDVANLPSLSDYSSDELPDYAEE